MAEAEAERYSDIYRDFSLRGEGGGTLCLPVHLPQPTERGVPAESNMATMESTLKAMANDVIIPEMKSAGIEDPVAKWVYMDPDGTVIATVEVSD